VWFITTALEAVRASCTSAMAWATVKVLPPMRRVPMVAAFFVRPSIMA